MNNQQTPNRECQYYNWNNNPNYPSYPSEYGARCEKKGEFFSLNAEGILSPDCSKCEEGKKQQMKNKTECPECLGNGYFLYPNEEECAACNGTGRKQMENKPNSTEIINNWAQWKKDIVGDKSALKCPLCGGEVFDYNQAYVFRGGKDVYLTLWECKLCKAVFQLEGLPAEARERFAKRPESVEAEILQKIKDFYMSQHPYTDITNIRIIQKLEQIEKEFKGWKSRLTT